MYIDLKEHIGCQLILNVYVFSLLRILFLENSLSNMPMDQTKANEESNFQ